MPIPRRAKPEETWVVPIIEVSYVAGPTPEGAPTVGFNMRVQTEPTEQFPDGIVPTPSYVMIVADMRIFCQDLLQVCDEMEAQL